MLGLVKIRYPYGSARYIFGIGMVILATCFVACGKQAVNESEGEKKMSEKTIEEVLKEHTDEWMSIPGVVGTAIGEFEGKACIKMYLVEKSEELEKKFPASLEGYLILLEETGEFKALDKD